LKKRLSEVSVRRDMFERFAEASLRDPFLETNCVPISRKEEALERPRAAELNDSNPFSVIGNWKWSLESATQYMNQSFLSKRKLKIPNSNLFTKLSTQPYTSADLNHQHHV
jgi:hypothetical protein